MEEGGGGGRSENVKMHGPGRYKKTKQKKKKKQNNKEILGSGQSMQTGDIF